MQGAPGLFGYVPIDVDWALTGSAWPPSMSYRSRCRRPRGGRVTYVVIISATLISRARMTLRSPAAPAEAARSHRVGAVFAFCGTALHWVALLAGTLLCMSGVTDGAVASFDRWNLLVFGPWLLGMGLLLAVAVVHHTRSNQGFWGVEAAVVAALAGWDGACRAHRGRIGRRPRRGDEVPRLGLRRQRPRASPHRHALRSGDWTLSASGLTVTAPIGDRPAGGASALNTHLVRSTGGPL